MFIVTTGVKAQIYGKLFYEKSLNKQIILNSGAELGKRRKREEGSSQSVAQETGKVYCSNAPAGKTGKRVEKGTKRKTQRRVTKTGQYTCQTTTLRSKEL